MKRLIYIMLGFMIGGLLFCKEGSAGQAGAFLKIGVGGRALGLGGCYVGIAEDNYALYWNVGGLAFIKERQLGAMYTRYELDRHYNYFSYVQPYRDMVIGFGIIRYGVDGIPETHGVWEEGFFNDFNDDGEPNFVDVNGNNTFDKGIDIPEFFDANANGEPDDPVLNTTPDKPTTQTVTQTGVKSYKDNNNNKAFDNGVDYILGDVKIFDYFSDTETAYIIGCGKMVKENVGVGLSIKRIVHELYHNKADGWALDFGLLTHLKNNKTRVGLSLRNVGGYLEWDTGRKEKIPYSITLGLFHKLRRNIDIAIDFYKIKYLDLKVRGGVEWWLSDKFGIRIGLKDGDLTFGASIIAGKFKLEYAYVDEVLGISQKMSLTACF